MKRFLLLFLVACGGADATPTGATCPPDNTLTYANFGQPFMQQYCTRCHASTLTGDARHGAPLFHDYDTLEGVIETWEHVDMYAAAGPNGINRQEPPSGAAPSDAERYQLGTWLACEVQAFDSPDAGP